MEVFFTYELSAKLNRYRSSINAVWRMNNSGQKLLRVVWEDLL